MTYKIGIFGSAVEKSEKVNFKCRELALNLVKHDPILITGASEGASQMVLTEAHRLGIREIWGFSDAYNEQELNERMPNVNIQLYSKIIYIPSNFVLSDPMARKKYRNVLSTANCDAGIIISGRWGTMNEFSNLYDMAKVIGVITETGGIADELESLCRKIYKKTHAEIIFSPTAKELVDGIYQLLKKRK
jgi:predicted Rossmann-fold nucleotide-binding protein